MDTNMRGQAVRVEDGRGGWEGTVRDYNRFGPGQNDAEVYVDFGPVGSSWIPVSRITVLEPGQTLRAAWERLA